MYLVILTNIVVEIKNLSKYTRLIQINNPLFLKFFDVTKKLIEAVNLTYGVGLKSVI